MKCINAKMNLLSKSGAKKANPSLRRRMSVKGAIKKTRAIIGVDCKYCL